MEQQYNKKGEPLYPIRIDNNTYLLVTKDKLNDKYVKTYIKYMEKSQKMGCNILIKDDY